MSVKKTVTIDHMFRQWTALLCIAAVVMTLLAGCGGGNLSSTGKAQTMQIGSATISSSGLLQPVVTCGGSCTEVT
jgi:ABC-type phosphate transport system substrate-binding protein